MRRGFVRALWGNLTVRNLAERRAHRSVTWDIKLSMKNKYEDMINAVTLVFGKDNYESLKNLGLNCVLIDDNPCFEDGQHQLRHKIMVLNYASHMFDEFVFLDFDTMLVKPLPDNFWEEHYKKEDIQIPLMSYECVCAPWRSYDQYYVPCACYIYMRNPRPICDHLMRVFRASDPLYTDEQVLAYYMDDAYNGWHGVNDYWDKHEPEFYVYSTYRFRKECVPFPDPLCKDKICFEHCQFPKTRLDFIDCGRKYPWLRELL